MESENEDAIEKEAVQEILSEVKEKDERAKQASSITASAITAPAVTAATITAATITASATTASTTATSTVTMMAPTINKRLYFRNLVSTLREPLDGGTSRKRKIVGLDCNLSEEEAEEKRSKWQSKKLIKGKDYDPDTEYIYDARMYFDPEKAKATQEYRNARKDIMEQRHQLGAYEASRARPWRGQGVVRGGLHRGRGFPPRGFFTRGRFLKSGRFLQRGHAMPRGYPVGQYPFFVSSSYERPWAPPPHLQDLPYCAGSDKMMMIEGQCSLNNDFTDSYISSDDHISQFIPATTVEKKSRRRMRRHSCSSSDIIFENASASVAGGNERHSLGISSEKRTRKKKKRVKKKHRHSSRDVKYRNHSELDDEAASSLAKASYYHHPMDGDFREASVNEWCHDRYSCEADDFPASRRSSASENLRVRSLTLPEGEGHLVNSECEMSEKDENADNPRGLPVASDERSCGLETGVEMNSHKSECLKYYKSESIRLRTKKKTAKKSKKKRKVKDLDDEERILIEEGKRLQEAIEQTTRLLYGFGNSDKYSVIRHYAKSYVQNTDTDDRLKVFLNRKIRRSCSEVNLFYGRPIGFDDSKSKDDMYLMSEVKNLESERVEFRKKYKINRIIKQVSDTSSSSDESCEGESVCSAIDFDNVSDLDSLRGRLLEAVNDETNDTSLSSRESGDSDRKHSLSPEGMALESSFSQKNHSELSGAGVVCDDDEEDILLGRESSPKAFSRTSQRSDEVGRASYENLQIMIKNSPAHYSHGKGFVKYSDEYKSLKDNYKDSLYSGRRHQSVERSSPYEKQLSIYSNNRYTNYNRAAHDQRRLDNGASFSSNSYSMSNDAPVRHHRPSNEHMDYYEEVNRSKRSHKSYNDQPKLYANQRLDDHRYYELYKGLQLHDRRLHTGHDISDRGRSRFEDFDKNQLHWANRGLYGKHTMLDHSTRLERPGWKSDSRTASSCVSMKKSRDEFQNLQQRRASQRPDRTDGRRQDLKDENNTKVFSKSSRDASHRPGKSYLDSGSSRLQSKDDRLKRSGSNSRNRHGRDGSVGKHNHRSRDKSASQRKPFSHSSRDKSTSCDSHSKPVNRSVQSTVAVIVKPGAKSEGTGKNIKSSKPIDSEKTARRGNSRVPSLTSYRSDKRRN